MAFLPAEGALIGAATGALLGEALKGLRDEDGTPITDGEVDFGSLMTEVEKERVRDRANRESTDDWSRYLTQEEKQRLVERSSAGVGVL